MDFHGRTRKNVRSGHSGSKKPRDLEEKRIGAKKRLILLVVAAIFVFLALDIYVWFSQDSSEWSSQYDGRTLKAVIVDELSGTVPDPYFVSTITNTLRNAGYTVDYVGPSHVTVAFFQDLPLNGYSMVIIRAHGGVSNIYTSEPYSKAEHVYQQMTEQVFSGYVDGNLYFGITDQFVRHSMHGRFHGTIVITMSCSGLGGSEMADAFLERGATSYVGWDRSVSAYYSDKSTAALLDSLSRGTTVREAINQTATQIGPDPTYHSQLAYLDSSGIPPRPVDQSIKGLSTFFTIVIAMVLAPLGVHLFLRLRSRRRSSS